MGDRKRLEEIDENRNKLVGLIHFLDKEASSIKNNLVKEENQKYVGKYYKQELDECETYYCFVKNLDEGNRTVGLSFSVDNESLTLNEVDGIVYVNDEIDKDEWIEALSESLGQVREILRIAGY